MKIGILTSGGDCQALNATMASLAKTLYRQDKDIELIGFFKGYRGLMYGDYKKMSPTDFEDILNVGGTILKTSRCPFKKMRVIEDGFDKVEAMKKTYKKLKLDGLVVLGGNGSLKSANMLSQEGLNVIGLPKTIDNDTWGTDYTFGFQSAVDIATHYLDEIQTTAKSHDRVFVVEIIFKNYLFVTAPYSPNEIPINLAFLTTSPAGSTYFNFPAVSCKGIAFTSVLSSIINFP